jgi:hypothetical protein
MLTPAVAVHAPDTECALKLARPWRTKREKSAATFELAFAVARDHGGGRIKGIKAIRQERDLATVGGMQHRGR